MSFLNNFNGARLLNKFFSDKKSHSFTSYVLDFNKIKPKRLCFGLLNKAGRNNFGKITFLHRGGTPKRIYRKIDFFRDFIFFWNIPAVVRSLEYDPNRSCFLALLQYANGYLSYILATQKLYLGLIVFTGVPRFIYNGLRVPLFSLGYSDKFSVLNYYCRSAGTFLTLLNKDISGIFTIKLPSGVKKYCHQNSLVTVGALSHPSHYSFSWYKAGQLRNLGYRPCVRGVAKNPVDHPHGGGQGKTSGGRVSVTPWGIYTKGYKTKRKTHEKKIRKMITY